MNKLKRSDLVIKSSLQSYFFQELLQINKQTFNPLPEEIIHYSSDVLATFSSSKRYFEEKGGRIKEKILGVKFLEVSHLPLPKAKSTLKDVGDTVLILCGHFPESLNRKILDTKYYLGLAEMAYHQLDIIIPRFLDVPKFYSQLAQKLDSLITLINLLAKKNWKNQDSNNPYLILTEDKKTQS